MSVWCLLKEKRDGVSSQGKKYERGVSWFHVVFKISIRNDPYWTSTKDSLELIELSSINKVSLV